MVIAEVPLWMVHSKSDQGAPTGVVNGSDHRAGAKAVPDARQAAHAASLWHPASKSPVYSIDCHSAFVCTGGGDGTARVWHLSGLFSGALVEEDNNGTGNHHHLLPHVGRVDERGGYASGEEQQPAIENGRSAASNQRHATAVSEASSSSSTSESSSDEDCSRSSSSCSSSDNVRDLTSVVRKKKKKKMEGEEEASTSHASGSPHPMSSAPSSSAASSPSPPRKSRHHRPRHRNRHHDRRAPVTTLTGHSGNSVLAVRFSNRGRLLATGGDDGLVLVYRTTIGGAEEDDPGHDSTNKNLEEERDRRGKDHDDRLSRSTKGSAVTYWPRVHMGVGGHELDVVDVAWSPDDSLLVSCSVDSRRPVLIWKLPTESSLSTSSSTSSLHLTPYKALSPAHHVSTVRGVTFDPAGSYLATSGDDPAVCVWRAHDDWGLEKRITDIFYRTPAASTAAAPASSQSHHPPPPPGYHHDPTFVRRLSWSTDGAYIACTNATVKNKHVAATVTRQGWATAGNDSDRDDPHASSPNKLLQSARLTPGGATLVGHRQPVVACRHCPRLLRKKNQREPDQDNGEDDKNGDDDDENQAPSYSTLLALGDKSGFVTVWTTQQSRPVFKIQCASRTTVTDLAWSTHRDDRLVLLASQLDGAVTALLFDAGAELPALLPRRLQARVFALKYGMDEGSIAHGQWGGAGGSRQPRFIESAMALAHQEDDDDEHEENGRNGVDNAADPLLGDVDHDDDRRTNPPVQPLNLAQEVAMTASGKKRVRPVLVSVGPTASQHKPDTRHHQLEQSRPPAAKKRSTDPVQDAVEAAERAASATATQKPPHKDGTKAASTEVTPVPSPPRRHQPSAPIAPATTVIDPAAEGGTAPASLTFALPYSIQRIITVDLPQGTSEKNPLLDGARPVSLVAECSNSTKVPGGTVGEAVPCADVILRKNGTVMWRDLIAGTHACEIAATSSHLAVGTADGVVYLYGNSPSVGWMSGQAFRSLPPLVIGHPVVSLRLHESSARSNNRRDGIVVDMLVVGSNGGLALYELFPQLRVQFKTSVLPPMHHMALSCQRPGERLRMPELSRIQFTESSGRLLLLLGYGDSSDQKASGGSTSRSAPHNSQSRPSACLQQAIPSSGVGGSLQGFVYDRSLELWIRVADSRFVLSDFYSLLPSKSRGELSRLDDAVRLGSIHSSWKPSLRRGHQLRDVGGSASAMHHQSDEDQDPVGLVVTRSHCEDRMSCALMVQSPTEFKHWLGLYVRALSISGSADMIRLLVDILLGGSTRDPGSTDGNDGGGWITTASWWLYESPTVLGMDRKSLVRSTILPELRKNLALQRLTNEITLELA